MTTRNFKKDQSSACKTEASTTQDSSTRNYCHIKGSQCKDLRIAFDRMALNQTEVEETQSNEGTVWSEQLNCDFGRLDNSDDFFMIENGGHYYQPTRGRTQSFNQTGEQFNLFEAKKTEVGNNQ